MKIRNFRHRGLRQLYLQDATRGLPAGSVDKIRAMLGYLQDMGSADELSMIPGWKAHQLTGSRKREWSLAVTRNWRLTFRIDPEEGEICDLNFEDYH